MNLIRKTLNFLSLNKVIARLNKKINIFNNVFCYENELFYPVYISDQKFENCLGLLMIANETKFHYVYIKGFNRFMCSNTKCRTKKHFYKSCLQCFSSEKVLIEHKKTCLK